MYVSFKNLEFYSQTVTFEFQKSHMWARAYNFNQQMMQFK